MAKKKDQEKFAEYSNNTNDAWEIEDRTMTLKILDEADGPSRLLSKKISMSKDTNKTSPSDSSSTNSNKSILGNTIDINRQKENKFKQIFEQSTVDLSKMMNRRTRRLFEEFRCTSKSQLEWNS